MNKDEIKPNGTYAEIRKKPNENHLLHFCGRGESNAVDMLKLKNDKK